MSQPTQIQRVFKRYEKKYLINNRQYQRLTEALSEKMDRDPFGQYTICNIYFDTQDYRLIRASLDKPVYKEKLRLRSYGTPTDSDRVFLELKKKFKSVVYKRRVPLTLKEAKEYLLFGNLPCGSGQILNEIDWFMHFYHPIPKVYIAYDRTALFSSEDTNLRVTFDTNIRFRESMLGLEKGDWGSPLLTPGQILMEIKLTGAMPLWLCRILAELKIYPTSYSKYGVCYREHLLQKAFQKGGNMYA